MMPATYYHRAQKKKLHNLHFGSETDALKI